MPGRTVTVYDGRPADELERRDRAARGTRRDPAPGAGRRPGVDLGRRRAGRHLALDHPRLPDDRAAAATRSSRPSSRRAPPATPPRPRSSPRRTCSSGCARRRRSASPAPRARRRRRRWRTRSSPPIPIHPAVLGGNIGMPLIERLPELTPDHRVVIELSELQLPTLSRGTTVAVYTNVTSDHLDRHGSVEAYRRVKRRLAELVDPDGALVLNLQDPVVGGYAGLGPRARGPVPGRPSRGRRARGARRLDRRGRGRAAAAGRRRDRRDRSGRRDHAGRRAGDPRAAQRLQRARRGRRRASCSASRPTRSGGPPRGSRASSTGSSRSASSTACGS